MAYTSLVAFLSIDSQQDPASRGSHPMFVPRTRDAMKSVPSNMEHYYLRLLDAITGMVAHVSAGEQCQFVNEACAVWLDVPREDVINRCVRDVLGDSAYRHHQPIIEAALCGDPVTFLETCAPRRKPDNAVDLFGRCMPLPDDGFVAHLMDTRDMEDRLAEREERKRQEYAHDMKNLLTPILSYLELLAQKFPDDRILAGSHSMFQHLALALMDREERYEARHTPITAANSHIRGVVATLIANRPDVAVNVTLEQGPGCVLYNGMVCLRVLGNLIRNSLRHAWPESEGEGEANGASKEIRVSGQMEADAYVLSVADNGIGFEAEAENANFLRHGLASVGRLCQAIGWRLHSGNGPSGGALTRIRMPQSDCAQAH